jgi:hypothetical protein
MFIAASHAAGLAVKRRHPTSPNAYFNISRKSLSAFRRDERSKGPMAILLAIASGIGGGPTLLAQWAAIRFWPVNSK